MGGPGSGVSKMDFRRRSLVKLIKRGATCAEIAHRFNVTRARGGKLLKEGRLLLRKGELSQIEGGKKFYTKTQATKKLGINTKCLNKVIAKKQIRGRLLVGSAKTMVFSADVVQEMAADELVTKITACRFCAEEIVYPREGKVFNVCRKKDCRAQYHAKRYRERYIQPFDPRKLRGVPKLVWEKLSSTPSLRRIDWVACNFFRKTSQLSSTQIMHLADLGIIKTIDSERIHPVAGKPIRLYALHEAMLIAEVVSKGNP